jgi:HEAT repeat protein
LGELKDVSAIPMLVQVYLDQTQTMVFQPALSAVASIGGKVAESALIEILRNRSHYRNIRWPAADALGSLGTRAAREALIDALEDDKADIVRAHAVKALGVIRHRDSLPYIRKALRDPDTSVRIAAAEALRAIPDKSAVADLENAFQDPNALVREQVCHALAAVDQPKLVDLLRASLDDTQSSWRGAAAYAMAEVLGLEALETVLLLSTDSDGVVREGVANALKIIPSEKAAERLLRMLDDESEHVRWSAVAGLAQHNYVQAVPYLIKTLQHDRSMLVQIEVTRALSGFNDRSAVPALTRLLEDSHPISDFAALALGNLGDDSVLPVLISAWRRHERSNTRGWFVTAIAQIGGPAAAAAMRTLLSFAHEDDSWDLIQALRQIKGDLSVPILLQIMTRFPERGGTYALEALASLPRDIIENGLLIALSETDAPTQRRAATLSPFYARGELLEALRALVADSDASVADAASKALISVQRRWRSE